MADNPDLDRLEDLANQSNFGDPILTAWIESAASLFAQLESHPNPRRVVNELVRTLPARIKNPNFTILAGDIVCLKSGLVSVDLIDAALVASEPEAGITTDGYSRYQHNLIEFTRFLHAAKQAAEKQARTSPFAALGGPTPLAPMQGWGARPQPKTFDVTHGHDSNDGPGEGPKQRPHSI